MFRSIKGFLKLSLMLMFFVLSCTQPEYENQIKRRIARYDDMQVDASEVELIKKNNYYIGFKRDDEKGYFIAILFKEDREYSVFKIVTEKKWYTNEFLNNLLIKADIKFVSRGFEFETIYDQSDSLDVVVVEKKSRALYALYNIDSINDIGDFKKYKLRKCFLPNCPVKF